MKMNRPVMVTGAAGFIGSHTAEHLLRSGNRVIGVDNFHPYYDARLKKFRLKTLLRNKNFKFYCGDILKPEPLKSVFKKHQPGALIHLAALAGVRSSLVDPRSYLLTNGIGALKVLGFCRTFGVKKVILASTSSLYAGQPMPFKETLLVDTPISPYAVSKKAAEFFGCLYHRSYGLDVTILRYFTVYGPAGRPDMSPFKFIKQITEGKVVTVYGDGSQKRDFTYIDDIARGTVQALRLKGFQTVNLGGNRPYALRYFIRLIEKYSGKKAKIKYQKWQSADMRNTWADISLAKKLLGWWPDTCLEEGVRQTVEWHKENDKLVRTLNA